MLKYEVCSVNILQHYQKYRV